MVQLLDLPDELLLVILSHCFDHSSLSTIHAASSPSPSPSPSLPLFPLSKTLENFAINKHLHTLARQAFFESYIHNIYITPRFHDWDEGTLLQDLYSPTFSCRAPMADLWTFVAQVRTIRLDIEINDRSQVSNASHEAVKELKRYLKLKRVYIVVSRSERALNLKAAGVSLQNCVADAVMDLWQTARGRK